MVALYARPGSTMVRQIVTDALVASWLVAWFLVARALFGLVNALAGPAQRTADTARAMSEQMDSAGQEIAAIPAVGERLATPLESISVGLNSIVTQAGEQVTSIHQIAWAVGAVTFALPALLVLWLWLPRRLAFMRNARATRAFVDADADLQLFALRAMAHLPMDELAGISPDPVGQWRSGNREVIRELADRELRRSGLGGLTRPSSGRDRGTPPAR